MTESFCFDIDVSVLNSSHCVIQTNHLSISLMIVQVFIVPTGILCILILINPLTNESFNLFSLMENEPY